jgi:hypothetical protein
MMTIKPVTNRSEHLTEFPSARGAPIGNYLIPPRARSRNPIGTLWTTQPLSDTSLNRYGYRAALASIWNDYDPHPFTSQHEGSDFVDKRGPCRGLPDWKTDRGLVSQRTRHVAERRGTAGTRGAPLPHLRPSWRTTTTAWTAPHEPHAGDVLRHYLQVSSCSCVESQSTSSCGPRSRRAADSWHILGIWLVSQLRR